MYSSPTRSKKSAKSNQITSPAAVSKNEFSTLVSQLKDYNSKLQAELTNLQSKKKLLVDYDHELQRELKQIDTDITHLEMNHEKLDLTLLQLKEKTSKLETENKGLEYKIKSTLSFIKSAEAELLEQESETREVNKMIAEEQHFADELKHQKKEVLALQRHQHVHQENLHDDEQEQVEEA